MDEAMQRLIVLHEREHVRGGDSRLLMAGLLLLVLLPWCLPLWWQFHRLRAAMEADCDQRVLGSGAPVRAYADALLIVARSRGAVPLPLVALVSGKAMLERRIRLLARPRSARGRLAAALLAASAVVLVAAATVPAPPPPSATALTDALRATGAPTDPLRPPLPPGALPGDPGQERLAAEIRARHSDAIAAGLPEGSVIWFIADRNGDVVRTGIEQGTEHEVASRIRARYPRETSDLMLAWDGLPAGLGRARVIWLLPGR